LLGGSYVYSIDFCACGGLALVATTTSARAQVGEPPVRLPSLFSKAELSSPPGVTVGPGQDLSDLKAIFQDGTPESFTQIGTAPAVADHSEA